MRATSTLEIVFAILLVLMAGGSALAQTKPDAKPKEPKPPPCFKKDEIAASAQVRLGLILRETGRWCATDRLEPAALEAWYAFDRENATPFQEAVTKRTEAFKRAFPEKPDEEFRRDRELTASYNLRRMSAAECRRFALEVDKFKEWKAFLAAAKLQEAPIKTQIRLCQPKKKPAPS